MQTGSARRRQMTRLSSLTILASVAILGAAACSSAGGGGQAAAPTDVPSAAGGSGSSLAVRQDASLGAFVVGPDGRSLYIFTKDSGGASACSGDCAATWPPLTVTAAGDLAAGDGVSGTLGTISRDDGTLQVTLGGHPLYYYAGDAAAGDTNGQGVGSVWYLAGPTGAGLKAGGSSGGSRGNY